MDWLYWLSQIIPSEKHLVGEKTLILSQLLQHGYPIIPGFVITSSLLADFLANLEKSQGITGHLSHSLLQVNPNNYQALQSAAQRSRNCLIEAPFPVEWQEIIFTSAQQFNSATVIVRPSLAIANYQQKGSQGLWRSQVCRCQKEEIALAIKKVWAELFTAKSLFYWQKLNLEISQVRLAVLIQPIENATASGTIELEKDRITIQATWGLGHSLHYGEVEPDTYILNRLGKSTIKQQLGIKTRGYCLSSSPDSFNCLETYLVKEEAQEAAVLNATQIALLVELIEDITRKYPQLKYFEWTSPQIELENSLETQFSLTQLHYFSSLKVRSFDSLSPIPCSQVLIKGIGASPGKIVAPVYVYSAIKDDLSSVTSGAILVTKSVAPAEVPMLAHLGGIITETGGLTSHAAIVARELGIPAIVMSVNATNILRTGELVMLDGDKGEVFASQEKSAAISKPLSPPENHLYQFNSSGIFHFPIGTELMVNLSQSSTLERVASLPINGIGLLRSEFMLLELLGGQSLSQWLHNNSESQIVEHLVSSIIKFAIAFSPRPVFYRSLDLPLGELTSATTTNDHLAFGLRGTASYVEDPKFFELELSALAQVMAKGYTNLRLILPFVRSVAEFVFCRDRVYQQGLNNYHGFQLWIMAEVPSTIFLLPEYIDAGIQGVAIGTSDLTQLLLGIDREQPNFNLHYNSSAVEKAIAKIVSTTQQYDIPCSICLHGTTINSPLIDKLIQWGIKTIAVEPQAISDTYRAIASAEQRLLLLSHRLNLKPKI